MQDDLLNALEPSVAEGRSRDDAPPSSPVSPSPPTDAWSGLAHPSLLGLMAAGVLTALVVGSVCLLILGPQPAAPPPAPLHRPLTAAPRRALPARPTDGVRVGSYDETRLPLPARARLRNDMAGLHRPQ